MDFDFGIGKKSQAKTGRRAKSTKSNASLNTNEKESVVPKETAPKSQLKEIGADSPPRPSRRMAGWGDADNKRDRNKGVEDSRLLVTGDSPRTRIHSSDEEGDDLQVIPDLDDVQNEDIAQQMAAPPSVAMNQVATYRELDSDLQRHSTFTLLDNEIDLKLLAKHMTTGIDEPDETWDWDILFAQISGALRQKNNSSTTATNDKLI
uniref:intraflagellar transport protein 43 homolog n=1 Tax=Styela clava TaxID=7725 RepID=UPI001939FF50|nr:intraflagellar transport protein 43 homolog [Styela clava]